MDMTEILLWMITGITVVAVALSGLLVTRIYGKSQQT